MFLPVEDVI
jgi:hypothetical protein